MKRKLFLLPFLLIPTGIYFTSSTNWVEKFDPKGVNKYCNNYANKSRKALVAVRKKYFKGPMAEAYNK